MELRRIHRCVFDVVLLIAQIRAHGAMLAANAISEERRVTAIRTVLDKGASIAANAIDGFVAKLASPATVAIDNILRSIDAVAVVAVPTLIRIEDEVAVPVLPCVIGVVAVLIVLVACEEAEVRDGEAEFLVLRKERPVEIEVATVLHGIPDIFIPLCLVIDFERTLGMKVTDDALIRKVTLPFIEVKLIDLRRPPLFSAIRAVGGRGNRKALPRKGWTHLLKEREILVFDLEGGLTNNAGPLHLTRIPSLYSATHFLTLR